MKKILFAAVAAALAFGLNLNAQHYNNARVGVTGGMTSSSSKIKDVSTKSINLYHAGLVAEIPLGVGFAFQPSLVYQMKGMSLDKWTDSTGKQINEDFQAKVGYVELPLQLQWGPDLWVFRPYGFVEPFAGYQITANKSNYSDELRKVEYGLSLGAGLDIWHLQVSAKYFWNFGSIYQSDLKNTGDTITGLKDGGNFNGIAFSLAIFF
ncbi:MAG: PorT family protein [Bacteroidales bacterium]|nr:PorT family protein [Bacteroidales bacterium]